MPLTAIDTPLKQRDLEATARAGALLSGAGLVGVLTAGPARLCLLPMGGGEGTLVDLAVESPQDLALLSKDVAVVRAGDGHLWGFVDLGGGARAKQVGRDARALCMRPSGESALALNQDGSATAITVSRQEIGARTIAVRGALRACDVGESVTYVVFDGEGGGQFRIHPGATPELGTSAKTTLPAEARELDLVRGGKELSAVWKRGVTAVCVVTGSPSRLSARMVTLEARPADMAVLDDALLVAFADGRLALYDARALAAAGDAPVEARSLVALASRGKPRIALVSAAKGSCALWIGTTAGEVFRAPLTREAAKVEEPPPPPPPAPAPPPPAPPPPPQEDLRATLATRDAELAAALAAREARAAEAEAERARLAGDHAAALEALRSELTAEHGRAIEALTAAGARALEEQAAGHARTVEDLNAHHARAVAERDAAGARALEELGAAHAAAQAAVLADHLAAVAAKEAAWSSTRAGLDGAVQALGAERDTIQRDLAAARARAAELEERARSSEEQTGRHERERALLDADLDLLRADLGGARARISELEADLTDRARAAEEEAGRQERERALLQADLDQLRADLTEQRAHLEKDFVQWGGRTISLEGARGALDAMLVRAQGIFNKRSGS